MSTKNENGNSGLASMTMPTSLQDMMAMVTQQTNTNVMDGVPSLPEDQQELLDKTNVLIDTINNSVDFRCDAACQKSKKEQALWQAMKKAETNLHNAPEQLKDAERAFLVEKEGALAYQLKKEDEYLSEAEREQGVMDKEFASKKKTIQSYIQQVQQNKIYQNAMSDLNDQYEDKISDMREDVDDRENTTHVANRKSYYDSQRIGYWCSWNTLLKVIFWIMMVLFAGLSIVYGRYHHRFVLIALIVFPILGYLRL